MNALSRPADVDPSPPSPDGLDPLARQVLDLERRWTSARATGRSPARGPKDRAVREELGLSPTRYHQLLVRTIELPEALAYDPALVRRLRRLRDVRRRARVARRLGLPGRHG